MKVHYWLRKKELIKHKPGDAQIWGLAYKEILVEVTKKEFEKHI